jgi:glyoxylase-like metal-dependent hydrolase (beta-lactamase superfamily II)
MLLQSFVNKRFNSNTFLIKSLNNHKDCYLIDIGNAEDALKEIGDEQLMKAIFLTHDHYDHICGIHLILERYPACTVFCSKYTQEALRNSKMNLSFYQQTPITYHGENIEIIDESSCIGLFEDLNIQILETPGHNEGCLTFKIGTAIFTGDSLIPHLPIVTKLKTGNKEKATQSVLKIQNHSALEDIIYPGHGAPVSAKDINWNFYLKNDRH